MFTRMFTESSKKTMKNYLEGVLCKHLNILYSIGKKG